MNKSLGFHSLQPIPSSGWALLGYGLSLLRLGLNPFLSYIHRLIGVPFMSLYYCYCDITYLFVLLLPLGLRAEAPAKSIFLPYSFFWPLLPSIPVGPIHFVPLASLAHLYLWASLVCFILSFPWAFTKFFGLPRPNYYILTFGLIGLWANPMY